MVTDAFIHHLTKLPDYDEQIAYIQYIPPCDARFGSLEKSLHPILQSCLESQGISSLYTHQAKAINIARCGTNVMIATASASGKTLCYNVPVLEAILRNRSARALYLFPTKALAQDQLRTLNQLACPDIIMSGECATFDGDTLQSERGDIKKNARVILTNPDMLHIGILPNHKSWIRILGQLKYVVIDEAHTYRGVFGSHVAQIIRRLRRLCEHYGSDPCFICCSATIANSGEHAEELVGKPFEVIDDDGSPHGRKSFVFWNPPIIDNAKATRRSSNSEATLIFTELIRQNIRSLVFTRTRKLTELIYVYSRDRLGSPLADRIKPYRAGYLAEDRRKIEQDLFNSQLLGVIATTALELGIDIGDLEATVLTGYPGSIASTWQQAGRSGRSSDDSLSFLIAQNNPLDQYFMNNPDFFFGKAYENALINLRNPNILKPHLICAAWEYSLKEKDGILFGGGYIEALTQLEEGKSLRRGKDKWYPSPCIAHPAQQVNIRSTSKQNYAVLDASRGYELLETVSASAAFFELYPGAIYIHQGESYLVSELDVEQHIAVAIPATIPYYTQVKEFTEITILEIYKKEHYSDVEVCFGRVNVIDTVIGFRKKMQFTEEVIGDELLDLPPQRFFTEALWFDLSQKSVEEVTKSNLDIAGGLHALEHAAIALLPLFALCDRNDIGGVSILFHPDTGKAQVFIYDACPGGIGITEKGFEIIMELWAATLKAIEDCPCEEGCPSCVQSPKCGNNNEPLDKKAAKLFLRGLVQAAVYAAS